MRAASALAAGLTLSGVVAAGETPLYEPPPAGSYQLPAIQRVSEHWLLDEGGQRAPVLGLGPGEVAVVAFVYTRCPMACPLALASLQQLDRSLAGKPALAGRTRLVTVSFDPAHDTPARMAELRAHLRPRGDWRFLTSADASGMEAVLADFGQDVLPLVRGDGSHTGLLRHVMKVFLVDAERRVRNVYSADFLSPELLLLDLETLSMEARG